MGVWRAHQQTKQLENPPKGFAKKQPNEFVPSMFGDGLLKENFLGVLNIFVPVVQIPTYLGSRGMLLFTIEFFSIF